MRFVSTRFGELEVADQDVVHFQKGILGFERLSKFALLPYREDSPFFLLHSIEEPDLCFVVTNPDWFRPDYKVEINEDDMRELAALGCEEISVFAIVTVPENPKDITANLLAPLLVNRKNGYAKQTVQRESVYRTRHLISEEIRRAEALSSTRTPNETAASVRLVEAG